MKSTDNTSNSGKLCFAHCKKPLALVLAFWMFGDMVMDAIQNSIYWKLSPDWNPAHPMHQSVDQMYSTFCSELTQADLLDPASEQELALMEDWKMRCSNKNRTELVCAAVNLDFKARMEKDILCQVRKDFQDLVKQDGRGIELCTRELYKLYFPVSLFIFFLPPFFYMIWFLFGAGKVYLKKLYIWKSLVNNKCLIFMSSPIALPIIYLGCTWYIYIYMPLEAVRQALLQLHWIPESWGNWCTMRWARLANVNATTHVKFLKVFEQLGEAVPQLALSLIYLINNYFVISWQNRITTIVSIILSCGSVIAGIFTSLTAMKKVYDKGLSDVDGKTQLHLAAEEGDLNQVKYQIRAGAGVDAIDDNGNTPIHLASAKGYEDIVMTLLEFKASVDWKNSDECTPLHLASSNGRSQIVELLLTNAKADINEKGRYEYTPLHWAASENHLETVELLLAKKKVDVNAKDGNHFTPLHWAASEGHLQIVKCLLANAKVNINAKSKTGFTPLHGAASGDHLQVVKLFLANEKVDVNAKDDSGFTPLQRAASGGHLEMVKCLLANDKINVNLKGAQNFTPLHWAASTGHLQIAQLLLANDKVKVNAKDQDGCTPLHKAVEGGHIEIVKLFLVDERVDVNARNRFDEAPIAIASQKGHFRLLELLLANGRVNDKSDYCAW